MRTSKEIKDFIIKSAAKEDYTGLFSGVFDDLKGLTTCKDIKAVYYRWASACDEISRECGSDVIDSTFCRSIICCNFMSNLKERCLTPKQEQKYKDALKRDFGWNIDEVMNGKHCAMAQLFINTLDFVDGL